MWSWNTQKGEIWRTALLLKYKLRYLPRPSHPVKDELAYYLFIDCKWNTEYIRKFLHLKSRMTIYTMIRRHMKTRGFKENCFRRYTEVPSDENNAPAGF